MKKLTFLLILFSGFMFSQEFILTPENFKNKDDLSKNYVVIEIPEKNKTELFKEIKKYVTANYKGLKFDGYNEVENEQIVLDISNIEGSETKMLGLSMFNSNISIRYEFNFKDGKFMIKPTFIKAIVGSSQIFLTDGNMLQKSIFNKKGKVSLKMIYDMSVNMNKDFIDKISEYIKNNKNSNW